MDIERHVLSWGVAIPVIYFGVQLAAAPFYPGYSFLARDASSLGSHVSTAPWIFNVGALVLGIVQLAVAWAFVFALRRANVGQSVAAMTGLALASAGLGSVNAFLHPLPDARHTSGWLFLLGSALVLLPVLIPVVLWRLGARRYAVMNTLLCLAVIPNMTGVVQRICMAAGINFAGYQSFLNNNQGLIQRAGAFVLYVPIGVVAYLLRATARQYQLLRRPERR